MAELDEAKHRAQDRHPLLIWSAGRGEGPTVYLRASNLIGWNIRLDIDLLGIDANPGPGIFDAAIQRIADAHKEHEAPQ